MKRVTKISTRCEHVRFVSANEILIVDSKRKFESVELTLDDGSIIIFNKTEDYVKFIEDGSIFKTKEDCIVVDDKTLRENHLFLNEDVVGYQYRNKVILEVDVYNVDNIKFLRMYFHC